MKILASAFGVIMAGQSMADDGSGVSAFPGCPSQAADVALNESLYEAGLLSSVLAAQLSGNTGKATEQIVGDLVSKIVMFDSQVQHNPCNASVSSIARVYPLLRVIAAVNHTTPIPGLSDNKDVQNILDKAIAENPKHYESLIQRSQHWGAGIK